MNGHNYANNNPVMIVDSDGHKGLSLKSKKGSSKAKSKVATKTEKPKKVTTPIKSTNIATKNNYRKLYTNLNPGMPKNYQVHHTLPQKYEAIMKNAGINIRETKYLRGVDPKIHSKITTEWVRWDKSLGRKPTAKQVQNFAKQIDTKYKKYWYKKGVFPLEVFPGT